MVRLFTTIDGNAHLWRHKFWGPAEGTSARSIPHLFFAQPIVGNFDVAVERQKNIVQLEISVNDTVLMKVLQSETDFSGIESAVVSNCIPIHIQTYCARLLPNCPR